ncbi:MAG: LysM peptidoglycan-binding domain-containing protein, partial [Acidobacteriota bacterium]
TRNYVPQILAAVILHKSPEKYGLTTRRDPPLEYETLPLDESLDLRVAARLAGTSLEEMIRLNPGLRRLATPPDYKGYPLHLPAGTAATFKTELARLPESERLPWYRHRVARGETLSTIAVRYGTSIYAIQQANGLKNPHRIYKGQNLMIPGSAVRVAALAATEAPESKDGERITHRVRRGDTLSSIARRYRTNIASLVEWNALSNVGLIRSGQKLVVYPGLTASQTAHPTGPARARAGGAGKERRLVIYTVRKGDTLYSIARRKGVSVAALQSWNRMGRRTMIHPGTRLRLYF